MILCILCYKVAHTNQVSIILYPSANEVMQIPESHDIYLFIHHLSTVIN